MAVLLVLLALVQPALSLLPSASVRPSAVLHRRASSPLCMPRPAAETRLLYIDGNNLMAHRKVTKGRDALAAKLQGIRPAKVTLVFDGKRGEQENEYGSNPRIVVTRGGEEDSGEDRETADEWIARQLVVASRDVDIEVVTADRQLRRVAHSAKVETINPAKFWRRYLPYAHGASRTHDHVTALVSHRLARSSACAAA